MRVVVIGGMGTIGSAVVAALSSQHEVVIAGRTTGSLHVDLASADSIRAMFQSIGRCDAVVSAAGQAKFGSLDELTDPDFVFSFSNKLMGQVNLIRIGRAFISDGASFTLTSGVLSQEPIKGSASISMVNAGLEAFVRAAALELPRAVRVNVVSPPWVTETLMARKMDPSRGMPAAAVAKAYLASIEGTMTGQTLDPRTLGAR